MKPRWTESIEKHRQQEQVRIDALKSPLERNKRGQFATPPVLALSLARYAKSLMDGDGVRFLDPAVGSGSFYSAALQVFHRDEIKVATGIELDSQFAGAARHLWSEQGLGVVEGDFTKLISAARYNLVLANPPYVRHHHILLKDKERLKAQVKHFLHSEVSGLAGLYCYFLLLCHEWMEAEGFAVWLIPSEFMDVNYGSAIRKYLTEDVTLLHIHRFCPGDVQFSDALVSSAVVVFQKSIPPVDHKAQFSFGGPIGAPQESAFVPLPDLRRSRKWTAFPAFEAVEHDSNEPHLGDFFVIKRGLATGCNHFFILTQEIVDRWQVPSEFVKPILPGPRYLIEDVIEAGQQGRPHISPQLFLLDCQVPEAEIKRRWPRFHEYLQTGHRQKINETYLTSRRRPWYSQEQRPPAPFMCTYMGRASDGKHPFRFIWNRSQATAHNVYLMLYPKGSLRQVLDRNPALYGRVFEALKKIPSANLLSEGRVYGGGLHKVEPKELACISAQTILDVIQEEAHLTWQGDLFHSDWREQAVAS